MIFESAFANPMEIRKKLNKNRKILIEEELLLITIRNSHASYCLPDAYSVVIHTFLCRSPLSRLPSSRHRSRMTLNWKTKFFINSPGLLTCEILFVVGVGGGVGEKAPCQLNPFTSLN